jgi:phosphatidylinositol alpha-mannosyltransferase
MRIALSYPWCWPAVRRGGERIFADLARYLHGAGHDVVSFSAWPDQKSREMGDRGQEVRWRQRAAPRWAPADVDQAVTYLPRLAVALRRADADVVHGLFHLDGVAARWSGAPFAVHVQGMPRRRNIDRRPVHRRLVGPSFRAAGAITAVSEAAARALHDELGWPAVALPNGVFVDEFAALAGGVVRTAEPSILFPGDPADPRKRLGVLVEALVVLRRRWPDVVLQVAAPVTAELAARIRASDPGVVLLDLRDPDAMATAYAGSWVACLPAVDEAFGLVIVEAMACGRPAVAVADGGVPEVLGEPRWLAAPDDPASLAAALDRALTDAAGGLGTEARCRELAAGFDWSRRGPRFEELYDELRAGRRRVSRRRR